MTTISEALIALVAADAGIVALEADRRTAFRLPEPAVLPATVYQKIDAHGSYAHGTARGLMTARYQVTHWASTLAEAEALATAYRHCLDGFHGTMGSVRVDSIMCEDGPDLDEPTADATRVIRDYFITYAEV